MTRLRALLQGREAGGTTADAVYQTLRHGIVHGDLAPGERLRSDALASELRVSRTPVREALRKLEAE
ncbi:MAG: GntR family transcriptional regulator, partial [Xanthobacteraceae bacterium]